MAQDVEALPSGPVVAPVAPEGRGLSAPAGAAQATASIGVEIGQQVRIAGKRGSYRVVGFRPGGIQLMDGDQKWHVVRPEAVRPLPASGSSRAGRTRPASN